MKRVVYYCYDAYCGWCYGFSPVMNRFITENAIDIEVEVLSGGMIITEQPRHMSVTASYIQKAYKNVEDLTGVKFGEDWLWHILNPDQTDWFPNSEKPAIALCILKEYYPHLQVQFASDLQYCLHFEGRDLCDNESYRHLVIKYNIPEEQFYAKLTNEIYKEAAYYEFALVKQLHVTGFPTVLLQASETKFYLLARGYTDYDTITQNLKNCLKEISNSG